MITFQTSVRIQRPVDDVFNYVSDPRNLPTWNSAVQSVREAPADSGAATYTIDRTLPSGHATNEIEIEKSRHPDQLILRTTSGPTPFLYRFHFTPKDGATVIHLDAQAELEGPLRLLAPVAQRLVRNGVDDNLETLRAHLEDK